MKNSAPFRILLAACFFAPVAFAQTPTPTATPACPNSANAADVTAWRQRLLDASVNPYAIAAQIDACFPTQIPACLNRFHEYYGPSGGINTRAGDVLVNQDFLGDPRHQLPSDLLVSGGGSDNNYVLRADAFEVARAKGWPSVKYKSRHSGGFDGGTSSLIMIEVPGAALTPPVTYDRFVNIAIPKDDVNDGTNPSPTKAIPSPDTLNGPTGGTYPFVTTQVTIDKLSPKPKLYFSFFERSGNSAAYIGQPRNSVVANCYGCHDSGLRAISPLGYAIDKAGDPQLSPSDWLQVKRLNDDMIKSMGVYPDWGQIMNSTGKITDAIAIDRYGPVVGALNPFTQGVDTRSSNFILGNATTPGCAASQPQISVYDIFGRAPGANNLYTFTSSPPVDPNKVADAMNCEACHNGLRKGVLTRATDWSTIQFKILVDKSMPLNAHKNPMDSGSATGPVTDRLNLNERMAVANCLAAEWQLQSQPQNVNSWLTELSCDGGVATAKKAPKSGKTPAAKTASDAKPQTQRLPSAVK